MKKLLVFCAACAVFVVGCGDKSGGDTGGTAGTSGTATGSNSTPGSSADKTGGTTGAGGGSAAGGAGFGAVQALFASNCTGCHGENKPKGGINLTSYEAIMKGGEEGPIVKAGDPEGSVLVQALHGTNHKRQMPPRGKLPDDQLKVVEDWIKDGAKS